MAELQYWRLLLARLDSDIKPQATASLILACPRNDLNANEALERSGKLLDLPPKVFLRCLRYSRVLDGADNPPIGKPFRDGDVDIWVVTVPSDH
jgi:hypothetical protein